MAQLKTVLKEISSNNAILMVLIQQISTVDIELTDAR
jgi:hypothetical protein